MTCKLTLHYTNTDYTNESSGSANIEQTYIINNADELTLYGMIEHFERFLKTIYNFNGRIDLIRD